MRLCTFSWLQAAGRKVAGDDSQRIAVFGAVKSGRGRTVACLGVPMRLSTFSWLQAAGKKAAGDRSQRIAGFDAVNSGKAQTVACLGVPMRLYMFSWLQAAGEKGAGDGSQCMAVYDSKSSWLLGCRWRAWVCQCACARSAGCRVARKENLHGCGKW